MKTVLILQCWGLGDNLFAQGIAQHFISHGYTVVWPVVERNVEALRDAYPAIEWWDEKFVNPKVFNIKDKRPINLDGREMEVAPIRWAESILKLPYTACMSSKYLLYNLRWETWREHAMWKRNEGKEDELMEYVGAHPDEPYTLLNTRFGTNAEHRIKPPNAEMRTGKFIEMRDIPGYSLFDWTGVVLGASEIHTVSTSLLYMLEMLDIKVPMHLYPRRPIETDFRNVEYIFTKPYILHK